MRSVLSLSLLLPLILAPCGLALAQTIAIIDAGSSSSKISVLAAIGTTAKLNITQPLVVVTPGLSDFAGGKRASCIKLKSAVSCAISNGTVLDYFTVIGNYTGAASQIALLGTAGMRSIGDAQAFALYQAFLGWAGPLYPAGTTARTLAGYEEALYGWITANAFPAVGTPGVLPAPSETQTVLDLGGVSAQITYATGDTSDPNVTSVNLPTGAASLFLQSYLGFGLDSALLTFLDNLLVGNVSSEFTSACLPAGSTTLDEIVAAKLFKSAAIELLQQRGIETVTGTADFDACLVEQNALFADGIQPYAVLDEEGNQAPAWNPARPTVLDETRPILAVGAYVNVLDAETDLPLDTPLAIGSAIVPAMESACAPDLLTWAYVYGLSSANAKQGAARRCIDMAHIRNLLGADGFNFDDESEVVLQATPTWGPGAASTFIVAEATPPSAPNTAELTRLAIANTVLLPIILVAVLVAVGIVASVSSRLAASAPSWRTSEKMKLMSVFPLHNQAGGMV